MALKLIVPELAGDPDFRARFERESHLSASIDHPNVIPVYEAGEADGRLFIAMRWVEGTDLRSLIVSEGRLDPARAVAIVDQIGDALDAAHSGGLVHRDVKPANVMLTATHGREHAYLTDFGLTKKTASTTALTQAGHFVGTPDYMPPEQIMGEPADARADVYALGCLLFHALTGRPPYDRESEVAKMYAHLHDPPPSAVETAPGHAGRPRRGDRAGAREGGRPALPLRGRPRPRRAGGARRHGPVAAGAQPGDRSRGTSRHRAVAGRPAHGTRARSAAVATPAGAARRGAPAPSARAGRALPIARALPLLAAAPWPGCSRLPGCSPAATRAGPRPTTARSSGEVTKPRVVANIPAGNGPDGITVNGNTVWVANSAGNAVTRLDAETNRAIGEPVPVGQQPGQRGRGGRRGVGDQHR